MHDDTHYSPLSAEAPNNTPTGPIRLLELDSEKYRHLLGDDLSLTDAQAEELLETLWSIMQMMVNLGFSHNLCEQILESFNDCADGAVHSLIPHTTETRLNREERNGEQ